MLVSWTFVELDEVGSTQTVAKELASKGAPEGTTVVARSQSSGGGREGRSWFSPAGGLYMSFILRPCNLHHPELITLFSSLAVVQGVKRATGLSTKIRWPNDIMVGPKKLGGVIAEAQSSKQEITQVVVGIGVNCNAPFTSSSVPGTEATSLAQELGKEFEISKVRHAVLDSFSALYTRWKANENLLTLWVENVSTIGMSVKAKMKTGETLFSYDAVGVDSDGGLVVTDGKAKKTLRAEDVEWLRENH
jgi:BirA family transcriptional regulator, biotin operon repressor / biotin---[acetyl-CoA-carboxylase] ligase